MLGKRLTSFLLLAAIHLLPTSALAASAVAFDQVAQKFGYCSKPTLHEAKQCAVAYCSKSGGRNCQITDTGTKGGYSAIATGNGQIFSFLTSYADEDMVSFYALNACILKVADCNTLTDKCPATSCKIIAKWKEPDEVVQSQSDNRQQQSQQTSQNAAPDQIKAMINQGHALLSEKRYREAIDTFTQAINVDPNNDDACVGRGLTYVLMAPADYRLALRDINQAISLNPKNGDAFLVRAVMSKRAGSEQNYLKDITKAAQLGNSEARELLNASAGSSVPQAQQTQKPNISAEARQGNQGGQAPMPSNSSGSGGIAGMYWCVAPTFSVGGTINLLPNGAYEVNGAAAGRYKAGRGQVHFDGSLKSWNNGVAQIDKDGNLIFEWTNSEGWKQYFAYRKGS